jgi:acylglycerol lipase
MLATSLPLSLILSINNAGFAAKLDRPDWPANPVHTALAPSNAAISTPPIEPPGDTSGPANQDQPESKDKQSESRPAPVATSETEAASTAPGNAPCIQWIGAEKPKAAILCIHGLSLHKGTFDALGKRLSKDGYAVFALDVRGFGDWVSKRHIEKVDLNGSLADIGQELKVIHEKYPDLKMVMLGESMGGGIALHATALYPNLVSGLISSVPAGDRFGQTDEEFKVGIHALLGGFNKQMNVGPGVVAQATKKEDLRHTWGDDPLVRMKLSPHELMQFQDFMGKNYESARAITNTPVLFIQGMNDKLVRPAGTWKLLEALNTPDRQIVFSKTAEHLILEEAQFSEQDIGFIENWMKKHILNDSASVAQENSPAEKPAAKPKEDATPAKPDAVTAVNVPPVVVPTKPANGTTETPENKTGDHAKQTHISYWIELYRNGKTYRCNNKYPFKTGDSIRFHLMSENDGYAYIVMKQGTSGKQAVLFPDARTGTANDIAHGQDYALPTKAWLTFDNNPGVEKLSIVFSTKPIDSLLSPKEPKYLTAYVSPDASGSKDLVPARMQLSWQDPDPVIIPQLAGGSTGGEANSASSLVMLSCQDPSAVLSLDVALAHN